jgi:hypothetical protein
LGISALGFRCRPSNQKPHFIRNHLHRPCSAGNYYTCHHYLIARLPILCGGRDPLRSNSITGQCSTHLHSADQHSDRMARVTGRDLVHTPPFTIISLGYLSTSVYMPLVGSAINFSLIHSAVPKSGLQLLHFYSCNFGVAPCTSFWSWDFCAFTPAAPASHSSPGTRSHCTHRSHCSHIISTLVLKHLSSMYSGITASGSHHPCSSACMNIYIATIWHTTALLLCASSPPAHTAAVISQRCQQWQLQS